MKRYRKKPVVIEATQFKPYEKDSWPDCVYQTDDDNGNIIYCIDTLEGRHIVSVNDWIITGVKGEKYPCKPDIFEQTYEEVKE